MALAACARDGDAGVVASLSELIALRSQALVHTPGHLSGRGQAPGQHLSRHKSRGMEFAESRPYQSGDDARTLDWRQTARRGQPYTKLFQPEHERPVQLLVQLPGRAQAPEPAWRPAGRTGRGS